LTQLGSNLLKHGVGFEEATQVFDDLAARVYADPDHSDDETRRIIVGRTEVFRVLFVSYSYRTGNIRIISAREANRNEIKRYGR
jgi:uncharacterized DUF497 family protein